MRPNNYRQIHIVYLSIAKSFSYEYTYFCVWPDSQGPCYGRVRADHCCRNFVANTPHLSKHCPFTTHFISCTKCWIISYTNNTHTSQLARCAEMNSLWSQWCLNCLIVPDIYISGWLCTYLTCPPIALVTLYGFIITLCKLYQKYATDTLVKSHLKRRTNDRKHTHAHTHAQTYTQNVHAWHVVDFLANLSSNTL